MKNEPMVPWAELMAAGRTAAGYLRRAMIAEARVAALEVRLAQARKGERE